MNCKNNNFTSTILPILNSTLVAKQEELFSSSDDLTFIEILTNPFFYGSSIIFIFFLLSVISIIIFIKNKPKLLLAKTG